MDNRFDPTRDTHSPADEPLELGGFEAPSGSTDSKQLSLIERAMAHQPVPRALNPREPELVLTNADRETPPPAEARAPQESEAKPGFLSNLLKRDKAAPKEESDKEKKGLSRRDFMRKSRNVAIGAGVVGYGAYEVYDTLLGASNSNMALLKKDHELGELGLVHRRADMSLLKFADRAGADALTFTKDNLESLVVSPELTLKLKQDESSLWRSKDDKNNTDGLNVRLQGTPRNIYIPYHLFAGAVSFSVYPREIYENVAYQGTLRAEPSQEIESHKGEDTRVVFDDGTPLKPGESIHVREEGIKYRFIPLGTKELKPGERIVNDGGKQVKVVPHKKLIISITGPNTAKDLPITTDIANAAQNVKEAVSDGVGGWLDQIAAGWDDFKDWSGIGGDGIDTAAAEAARQDAEKLARERAKPHPQVKSDFYLEMDYPASDVLPNLHFYNGRTLMDANYHILGEEVAKHIAKQPRFGMRIIGNSGIDYNDENGHIGEHKNVAYYSKELERRAEAATRHPDSTPEKGVIGDISTGLKKFAIADNKLNAYEEAALSIASEHIKRSEDGRWTWTDRLSHRVFCTPDQGIGR